MGLPASSPGLLDRATAGDRAARVRYRRALMLMVMTLVVPGSAQLVAGNRRVGRIATRIWVGARRARPGGCAARRLAPPVRVLVRLRHHRPRRPASRADGARGRLGGAVRRRLADRPAAVAVAGAPPYRRRPQRRPLLLGRRDRCSSARTWSASSATSSSRCSPATPCTGQHDGRYNVLLVGGDSGAGRWGLRTDSMTVASIDADDRQDRADRAAAQHDGLPVRQGLGHAQGVAARLRLRLPQLRAERHQHLGGRPHVAVQGRREPRHERHHLGHRGDHRAEDQLLGDRQPGRLPRPGRRRRRRHPQRPAADPGRGSRGRRHRLHQARGPQAGRLRHAVVRPVARQLRRLLADGPPEVRDERDAPPGQPADGPDQLREDRQGLLRR